MTIDENLKLIEHRLTHRCTASEHDAALESLAALREQIAGMERKADTFRQRWEEAAKDRDTAERLIEHLESVAAEQARQIAEMERLRDKFEGALICSNAACRRRDERISALTAERDHLRFDLVDLTSELQRKIAALEAAVKERDARGGAVDQFTAFLTEFHGSRCDEYEAHCLVCEAWNLRDSFAALSPASTPSTEPAEPATWRVGSKVAVNLYRGDEVMGQCQTAEIAVEIVARMNAAQKEPQ